jgi:CHAD domain-containing protein
MAYRFERDDHDVIDGLRRIALEQIDGAIASVDGDGDPDPRVHDIRKRMKKLRGLIRLVRPAFPDYAAENAHFRDTAKSIAGLRDAAVMTATLDRLLETHKEPLDTDAFEAFREGLADQRGEAPDLGPVREALVRARGKVDLWTLREPGWDAIAGGLGKIYRQARDGADAEDDEALHAWRKPVKYHWYHTRLLEAMWPEEMTQRAEVVDEIGEFLGLHQDLAVLERALKDADVSRELRRVLGGLIGRRKAEMRDAARELAPRLFNEKPKALVARWGDLWTAWRGD